MNTIKRIARSTPLTAPLYKRAQAAWYQMKKDAMWRGDQRAVVSRQRLKAFENRHLGQRCFIIGNGPSLKKMDLSPLKNEITFGMNRIYLLFPEIGFQTTYYVSVNFHVLDQFAQDIEKLTMPKFLDWDAHDSLQFTTDMMFLRSIPGPLFSKTPDRGVWQGATVTYVSMQLAYYMGFKTVYLIGVDHNFDTKGPANKLVVAESDDSNHFHPNYFGKGYRWQLPDLETSEIAYQLAKNHFEQDGRQINDATVGGKLQIFPKVDYTAIVNPE